MFDKTDLALQLHSKIKHNRPKKKKESQNLVFI